LPCFAQHSVFGNRNRRVRNVLKHYFKLLSVKNYFNFKSLFPRKTPSMAFCGSSWGKKEEKYFSLLTNYVVKVRINISVRRKRRITCGKSTPPFGG